MIPIHIYATHPSCCSRVLPQSASKLADSSLPEGAFGRVSCCNTKKLQRDQTGSGADRGSLRKGAEFVNGLQSRERRRRENAQAAVRARLAASDGALLLQPPARIQPIPLHGGTRKHIGPHQQSAFWYSSRSPVELITAPCWLSPLSCADCLTNRGFVKCVMGGCLRRARPPQPCTP